MPIGLYRDFSNFRYAIHVFDVIDSDILRFQSFFGYEASYAKQEMLAVGFDQ